MENNENRKVILEEHNPNWSLWFEEEKVKIQALLNSFDTKIEHVGSTSVPDLISKPIIDIVVAIESFELSKSVIGLLETNLEYHYDSTKNVRLPERRYLWKGDQDIHYFHIWIVEFESKDWKDMTYVRDYLRSNEKARKMYGDFKRELIDKEIDTIANYRVSKSKIYNQLLDEAWNNMESK